MICSIRKRGARGSRYGLMWWCLPVFLLCSGVLTATAQTFHDATDLLSVQSDPAVPVGGAAAVDVNIDGLVDLYHRGRLYMQQPDGRFMNMLDASGIRNTLGAILGGVWGDYDADGDLDVFLPDTLRQSQLYNNRATSRFVAVQDAVDIRIVDDVLGTLWADFDNDGTLDLFVGTNTGERFFYFNSTGGRFQEQRINVAPFQQKSNFCAAAAADFDRDRDMDLYVTACGGTPFLGTRNELMTNLGNRNLRNLNFNTHPTATQRPSRDAVWFDYDNDGWLDLFVVNESGGDQLWKNNGPGGFVEVSDASGIAGDPDDFGLAAGAADFDNDGWVDLYVVNRDRPHRLFHNNGDGTFTDRFEEARPPGAGELPGTAALALADLNNDGWIDVFLASQEGNRLWYNDGGTAHWIKVRGVGRLSERSGIGLRVEVQAGGRTMVREITAGSGIASQHHNLTAHFGLGAAARIDDVILRWPSGLDDGLGRVAMDQEITVLERRGVNQPPLPFVLLGPANETEVDEEVPEIVLSWAASGDPEGDSLSYQVHLTGPGVDVVFPHQKETELRMEKNFLVPGPVYAWSVTATDGTSIRGSQGQYLFKLGETVRSEAPAPLLLNYGLDPIRDGSLDFGDYDEDGDLDLLLSGAAASGAVSRVYRLDDSLFVDAQGEPELFFKVFRDAGAIISPLALSTARWGDYDGDGDLDILLMGMETDGPGGTVTRAVTNLFRNVAGLFIQDLDLTLTGLHSGDAAWGDYDGDGDLDLVLTGATQVAYPFEPLTRVYRNQGGILVEVQAGIPGAVFSAVAWGDYDGDGDLDLALAGDAGDGTLFSDIYRNDGQDRFTPLHAGLPGLAFAALDWGDYDGDGDLDLLAGGSTLGPRLFRGITRIYRNDGGLFSDAGAGLKALAFGDAAWADYDDDGDLDVLMIGAPDPLAPGQAWIYRNEAGRFTPEFELGGVSRGALTIGDYNGDGDLDFITVGVNAEGELQLNFHLNRVIPEPVPQVLFSR